MAMTKAIASTIPGFLALGILSKSVQTIPKNWGPKGVQKVGTKDLIGSFVPIVAGMAMLKPISTSIAAL